MSVNINISDILNIQNSLHNPFLTQYFYKEMVKPSCKYRQYPIKSDYLSILI